MSIENVFESFKTSITEKNLIPASLIKDVKALEEYQNYTGKKLLLFEDVEKLASQFNIDSNKLFFSSTGFSEYIYYSFPFMTEITSMNAMHLSFMNISELIEKGERYTKKILKNKNFEKLFSVIPDNIKLEAFRKLYDEIPDSQKFEIFLSVYSLSEYNFDILPRELIEDLMEKRTIEQRKHLITALNEFSENDELLIYRGISSKSTSVDKALSWTLSFNVAEYFASRFNADGNIYSANIKKEDVLAYITSRDEEEVLVFPETLYNVKNLKMVQTKDEIKALNSEGGIEFYHYYTNHLRPSLFENPEGIHGLLHAKRVLFHALSLSREFQLSFEDREVLCISALFHDIGREGDEEDIEHGALSWEKAESDCLLGDFNLYEDQIDAIEFIIKNHCIDDEKALPILQTSNYNNKQNIERLYKIFKDCDALDRVRTGDLNINYLRHDEAKRRILFAKSLLLNIR